MPIEVDIWKIQAQPQKLGFSALASEAKLENMLKSDLAILSPDWMYLGSQVLSHTANTSTYWQCCEPALCG